MTITQAYKIRPAARHILTIGRDLIQDSCAAVIELVKNAYDADSPDVKIEFKATSDQYEIIISDHGHGMSRNTVINKWMVPSTSDKLKRKKTPLGRIMQGRKGIGRYAASILGNKMFLETITQAGEKTTILIDWDIFETSQYLDEIDFLIETSKTSEPSGTKLSIKADSKFSLEWDKKQFDKLISELRKMKSPVDIPYNSNDEFQIQISIRGFPCIGDFSGKIVPYPIFDLFDYRISGSIESDGKGTFIYSQQKYINSSEEDIHFNYNAPTGCGKLSFDIRVYDRDKDSIESLIGRGLKNPSGTYVGKLDARQILNQYNGLGVYRNGFRIRPLGDAAFDWLELNKRRVQNPSLRIGSNQVIGFVLIQEEEKSGLVEKSARDGMKENAAYQQLIKITQAVITELETRRFTCRRKLDLVKSVGKMTHQIELLQSSEKLKNEVQKTLRNKNVDQIIIDNVIESISKDNNEKNKIVEDISKAVAIYQGQATLGKIINVILHEGRHPLNYFNNEIPNMRYWVKSFKKENDMKTLEKIMTIANGIGENANMFARLFRKLDPLTTGSRPPKKQLKLKENIEKAFDIFTSDFEKNNITTYIDGSKSISISGWVQDIVAIFANLIENSIYWIEEKKEKKGKICVRIATENDRLLYIDYRDTGLGIDPKLIANEAIFEPGFSTKPHGTGLGLAIAGESASRCGLRLEVFQSQDGAYFRLLAKDDKNV